MRKHIRDVTGIPEGTSHCVTCKLLKNNLDFHWYAPPEGEARTRVNGSCRVCRSKLGKETEKLKKKVVPHSPKPIWEKPCEACLRPVYERQSNIPEGVDGTYSFNFDHEHGTEDFRGWICTPCNTGFGLLGDTVETIEFRLKYLKRAKFNLNESQKKYHENINRLDKFYN